MPSRRDNFVKLANARVSRALEAMRLVGNLSNRSNYTYSDQDVEAIIGALRTSVAECKKRFETASMADKSRTFLLE